MAKLGIDLDGCLCNFNDSYAKVLTEHTGIVFPKNSNTWPTEWYWERAAGVTKEQESWVWKNRILQKGSKFWQHLTPLEGAMETLKQLNKLSNNGHDIYFITNRPGDTAKRQTEEWLYEQGMDYPTVIISSDKLPVIHGLDLTFFVDDKIETIDEIANDIWHLKGGHLYLKIAPYNRTNPNRGKYKEASSVAEALQQEGLWV
jgi:uncharacterized HAD superfamily protein